MPFASHTVTVERRDDDRWTVIEPLIYRGRRDTFVVPAGYVTDFASVPRLVVWLIPRFGRYTLAAILHDWCCDQLPAGRATSREVDGLFRRVMRELGVPPLRRWLMWCGVRWGALLNHRRRAGWWRDLPAVVGLSVVAAPIVAPAALLIALGLALYAALEFLTECLEALS